MAKTFKEIRGCVRAKVRAFCFVGAQITDDEIGSTKVSDLHLTQNSNMPGIPPAEALAVQLKQCADINVDLSGDQLINNPDLVGTVDTVAQLIYGQTI